LSVGFFESFLPTILEFSIFLLSLLGLTGTNRVASIYFHIPFCKRLCGYCDFYRSVKVKYIPDVVEAMHRELVEQRSFLRDKVVHTIYFGGGTPSLLAPSEIERFVTQVRELFDCSQLEEVTIEVNPDDVTPDYVAELRKTSVNRVSMGIQSLDDGCLQFMGRRHTSVQAVRAVKLLQDAGYDNISVDVIFGVAGYGADLLERTLQGVLAMGVQHISAYHLTIEEGTRFGRMLARGEMSETEEERSEAEFLQVHNRLTAAGYAHYEVSNYALEGCRSRHNSSYWRGVEYLGIGPGAHSFNGDVRRWCEQKLEDYILGVEYGSEVLSSRDKLNEYVMTSLRCVEGLSLAKVESEFGLNERARLEREASKLSGAEILKNDDGWLRIAPEKMLLSDLVIESLIEL
jgi:oxygen-independent coproporphyrinogen-3 oxidase